MRFIYTLLIFIYSCIIALASAFNRKAKLKTQGILKTNSILNNLKQDSHQDIILIHCSSQGEHEQALPILRWIRNNTKYKIVLSFFSPSGFSSVNYNLIDRITQVYLPFDTPSAMSNFVNSIQPKIVLIIKNEWWWNLLHELKNQSIPTYLISATIRNDHYFLKFPIQFFKNGFSAFTTIFVVDKTSKDNITTIYNNEVLIGGDTRIDQTLYTKEEVLNSKQLMFNLSSKNEIKTIVYGSIWESDINSINKLISIYPDANHLIYPHELSFKNLEKLKSSIHAAKIVSSTKDSAEGINIVSVMGELKYAYALASAAYIGGGFGEGIHNVLEANVYNIPTIFGPNYRKSLEAKLLVQNKCAFTFHEISKLKEICTYINKEKNRKEIETNLKSYFSPSKSPTEFICHEIFKK